MAIAALALAGVFVALYLTLHRMGFFGGGALVCGVGSCDVVQASRWAVFLGLPVAAWGLGFYIVVLAAALVSVRDRLLDSLPMSAILLGLATTGFLFSAWLTYLELFVINAICQWCVVSAILATGIFVAAVLDFREVRSLTASESA
jgi:uncharacterized membrane protein